MVKNILAFFWYFFYVILLQSYCYYFDLCNNQLYCTLHNDHNGHYRFMCSNIHNIYPAPTQNIYFKADKKSFRLLDTYLLIFTTFVLDSMQCLPKARSASFFSWSKNIIAGTR